MVLIIVQLMRGRDGVMMMLLGMGWVMVVVTGMRRRILLVLVVMMRLIRRSSDRLRLDRRFHAGFFLIVGLGRVALGSRGRSWNWRRTTLGRVVVGIGIRVGSCCSWGRSRGGIGIGIGIVR